MIFPFLFLFSILCLHTSMVLKRQSLEWQKHHFTTMETDIGFSLLYLCWGIMCVSGGGVGERTGHGKQNEPCWERGTQHQECSSHVLMIPWYSWLNYAHPLKKKCVKVLNLSNSQCDLIWKQHLYRENKLKQSHWGWTLIQYGKRPYKGGKLDTDTDMLIGRMPS